MKMPKLELPHAFWVFSLAMQTISCWFATFCSFRWHGLINIACLVFFLRQKCNDPLFGVGRRYYWMRQASVYYFLTLSIIYLLT